MIVHENSLRGASWRVLIAALALGIPLCLLKMTLVADVNLYGFILLSHDSLFSILSLSFECLGCWMLKRGKS